MAVLVVAVAAVLAGCGALLHTEAVRLCRSLTPVLNGPSDRIDIRRAEAERTPHGLLVVIAYAVQRGSNPAERRAISCIFSEGGPAGRLDLTNLATERGPVGDVRLHFIKRHWIDKGHAVANDPQPIALSSIAPDVPARVAPVLQVMLSSLSNLGIYALLAASYALIYGLIGRIHLAFGELAMLSGYGAFLGFWISGGNGLVAYLGAAILGIAVAAVHGGTLGRFVFERLLARPGQHVLVATLGLAIAWSEAARLSQGAGQKWLSPILNVPIGVARADAFIVTVTPMGVLVPVLAAILVAASLYALASTSFGRRWRAVSDDPLAAALNGVSSRRVMAETMLLGSTLAGAAGVLMLFAYGGVGHSGGLVIGLKALIAAIIGGIGSVRGAVLGALAVGISEALWSHFVSIESRDLAIFVALTAVLIWRPDGLFVARSGNA